MKIKEKISIEKAALWTGSTIVSGNPHSRISQISTDSRTIEKGDFFIPVKGENFDGHDFIDAAVGSGASGFVYEKGKEIKARAIIKNLDREKTDGLVIFEVSNGMDFLKKLATGYIRQFKAVPIGITGSLGKTTTKGFISAILSTGYRTVSTPKNYNTEIGISKTIFGIDYNTDYFIAELGMRGAGQIGDLAEISNVKIGAITSISGSHMEFFDDIEELAAAKAEIAGPVERNGGVLFLNADDDMTAFIRNITAAEIIEFGDNRDTDYNFRSTGSDDRGRFSFDLFKKFTKIGHIKCSQPGFHNLYNGCLAAAVCHYLGADIDMIRKGMENARTEAHRMKVIECREMTILDDCYNASPVSVRGALDTLSMISENNKRRSVAILGDMLELGDSAPQLHFETGQYSAKKDIDVLIASGKLAKNIYQGFMDRIGNRDRCFYFSDKRALTRELENIIKPEDIILVKGSRANKLEDIVMFLTEFR